MSTPSTLLTPAREETLRRVLIVLLAALLAALIVGTWQARRADATARAEVSAVKTARTAVPAILSYTDSNLKNQLATSQRLMTPGYAKRYATMVKARVWPRAEKYGVANQVGVVSVGTVEVTPDSAVVLVFANQTTRTKDKPEGITQGSRLRVTLERQDERWLVDDVRPL